MPRTPSKDASIDRLVDIASFALAYAAYSNWLTENSKEWDSHLATGVKLFKKYYSSLEASLPVYIEPLLDKAVSAKPLYHTILSGDMDTKIVHSGNFFDHFFKWVKAHPQDASNVFTGRSQRAAYKIAAAVQESAFPARLNHLAGIPSVSGANVLRKWIEESAKLSGAPITTTESVMTDAESSVIVAHKLQNVETGISVADTKTQTAADLQGEKADLLGELENIQQTSKSPETVMAVAATTLAQHPTSQVAIRGKLNAEQTAAMLADGKVLISAGAGSGKTRVIAAKVAHLVEEKGYKPEQILATSFTNKSAAELKHRVENTFGVKGANVATTHSICRQIINDWGTAQERKAALGAIPPDKDKRDENSTSSKQSNADQLFGLAVAQVQLRQYGNQKKSFGPPNYWKDPVGEWFNMGLNLVDGTGKRVGKRRLMTMVGNFQSFRISPEKAWDENKDSDRKSLAYMAAVVYAAYEWLKHNHTTMAPCMDFNDWLNTANDIVHNNQQAANALQSQYKAVLVDEAQDLNKTQHSLFQKVGEKADTMAYIGDDKQAIYAFRGAVPEEFVHLPEKGYKLQSLETNYRSGSKIVDAANTLIAHNGNRQIPMVCKSTPEKGTGTITAEETESHEMSGLRCAEEIENALKTSEHARDNDAEIGDPVTADDFGIMVRNNAEKDAFELGLIAKGIPYRSKGTYFNKPQVMAITNWMTIAAIHSKDTTDAEINDAVLRAHMNPGFFLGDAFKQGLMRACPKGRNYFDFLTSNEQGAASSIYNQAWQSRQKGNIIAYADALKKVAAIGGDDKTDAAGVIAHILNIDGAQGSFKDWLIESVDSGDISEEERGGSKPTAEMIERASLAPIRPLIEMAKSQNDPAKFMAYIKKMKLANRTVHKGEDDKREPAVQLDTVHQWKGLEKKHVFISMASGVFPHFKSDEEAAKKNEKAYDDERRLAYVAITRGEKSVHIFCPRVNYLGKDSGPSRFVGEACIPITNLPEAAAVQPMDPAQKAAAALKPRAAKPLTYGELIMGSVNNYSDKMLAE